VIEIHIGTLISIASFAAAIGAALNGALAWWLRSRDVAVRDAQLSECHRREYRLRRDLAIARRHDD
jgi:hypothetical protein